jgi:ribosomal protein L14E/L6E/L27E
MREYFEKGAIVQAIAGREKGEIFVVVNESGDFVTLVNGINRTLENPKKKNKKHLHLLCKSNVAQIDMNDLSDAQVKKFLNNYSKSRVK